MVEEKKEENRIQGLVPLWPVGSQIGIPKGYVTDRVVLKEYLDLIFLSLDLY